MGLDTRVGFKDFMPLTEGIETKAGASRQEKNWKLLLSGSVSLSAGG
jgi:hypothetical protein